MGNSYHVPVILILLVILCRIARRGGGERGVEFVAGIVIRDPEDEGGSSNCSLVEMFGHQAAPHAEHRRPPDDGAGPSGGAAMYYPTSPLNAE